MFFVIILIVAAIGGAVFGYLRVKKEEIDNGLDWGDK